MENALLSASPDDLPFHLHHVCMYAEFFIVKTSSLVLIIFNKIIIYKDMHMLKVEN